jgi:ABC-type branched-subunit amino acid transport system substrate-binding protein
MHRARALTRSAWTTPLRRAVATVGVAAIAVAACSTSSSPKSNAGTPTSASGVTTGALTASARGVSASEIKIGFTHPDFALLAKTGLIKLDPGPYEEMMQALVDDVNAHGGVNGRKLQLFNAKYSVLTASDQLAACTKMTEDDQVFAILGGFIADDNLCAIQQHATLVIYAYGTGFNRITLAKAKAPFVTWEASDERSTTALVRILDQQGRLKNKTIAVYATQPASKPLIDLTVKALRDSGYSVKDSAINDAATNDSQALNAQDKVIGSRFKDEGIDTVIVQGTIPPASTFDALGYRPTFYAPQSGNITAGAYTNPFDKFPLVAGLAPSADIDLGYDTPAMQHCRDVWKQATGKVIERLTVEQRTGKPTGFQAMQTACSALQLFVAAAKAAGPNLTYQSFQQGLSSLGTIVLPIAPVASFRPNKPDGQDSFQLMQLNPAWKPGSSVAQLLPLGAPTTLTS